MYAFRTLYRLAVAKKVKINYFVVDARTGRGIDRSLDRIKSRATRLPFPRVFLPYFFFFFLPPPLLPFFLIFLIFIFIAADTNAASVLFFPDTVDDTQRKMITLFVVAKEWRKRSGLAISRTKFFFRCLPVEKGFISTLRRKSRRRSEDSRAK